jgi:hypothetical protein
VHAILHVHTEASSGRSSDMDEMISGAIRAALGDSTGCTWRECFTPVSRLVALLDDPAAEPPVGIVAVADHQTAAHHRLPDDALRAAAREPRLALCAEVWCEERDRDGVFRKAPEVLVYGGSERVDGPFGPHYGLSQALLDELFETCRAAGRRNPQTSQVLEFCGRRGLACALAHPFDGHDLSLEATFDLISRGRFVETVNGGFPAASTRVLEDLIAFHNRIVAGGRLGAVEGLRYPAARRLAERIADERRPLLHPWGGSDAHSHAFARVTMRFLSDEPAPAAGDLFRAMLERPVGSLLLDGTFRVCGRPGSALSVMDDVVRIVMRNVWFNLKHFGNPVKFADVIRRTRAIVAGELGRRARRQAALHRDVERDFNFARLLPAMRPGTRAKVTRHSVLPLVGVE